MRPSKFSAELGHAIAIHIGYGCTVEQAAEVEGIAPDTIRRWLRRYPAFARAPCARGSLTDGETTATAETVRAYILLRLPAGFFAVPLPNGGIDMTATAIFRITREPWVRPHT